MGDVRICNTAAATLHARKIKCKRSLIEGWNWSSVVKSLLPPRMPACSLRSASFVRKIGRIAVSRSTVGSVRRDRGIENEVVERRPIAAGGAGVIGSTNSRRRSFPSNAGSLLVRVQSASFGNLLACPAAPPRCACARRLARAGRASQPTAARLGRRHQSSLPAGSHLAGAQQLSRVGGRALLRQLPSVRPVPRPHAQSHPALLALRESVRALHNGLVRWGAPSARAWKDAQWGSGEARWVELLKFSTANFEKKKINRLVWQSQRQS